VKHSGKRYNRHGRPSTIASTIDFAQVTARWEFWLPSELLRRRHADISTLGQTSLHPSRNVSGDNESWHSSAAPKAVAELCGGSTCSCTLFTTAAAIHAGSRARIYEEESLDDNEQYAAEWDTSVCTTRLRPDDPTNAFECHLFYVIDKCGHRSAESTYELQYDRRR